MRAAVNASWGDAVEYVDLGVLEGRESAEKAARFAQDYRRDLDGGCIGIICSLFNFSDENAIQDFVRLADMDVPILLRTEPDQRGGDGGMGSRARRDGACGRFSVANALRPYRRALHFDQASCRSG